MSIIFDIFTTLLNIFFAVTGDWGIAIVFLTILVKILLFPLSINQKNNIYEKQKRYLEIEELKNKFKDNTDVLEKELSRYQQKNSKQYKGYIIFFIQLVILVSLYITVINMPAQVGTILVPWVTSIKMRDNYFIIPIIYTMLSLLPFLFPISNYFDDIKQKKAPKNALTSAAILSLIITINAPIAIGIYFIAMNLLNLFEDIGCKFYFSQREFSEENI